MVREDDTLIVLYGLKDIVEGVPAWKKIRVIISISYTERQH